MSVVDEGPTIKVTHIWSSRGAGAGTHKGRMGRALLKDILARPLGLGLGREIFQSDGCVM